MRFNGKKVSEMSYEDQNNMLIENGSLIRCIRNPTYYQECIALESNPFSIKYIENPSEVLQMIAIHNDYHSIRAIMDPCKMAQIEAAFKYTNDEIDLLKMDINNPCDEVLKLIETIEEAKQ